MTTLTVEGAKIQEYKANLIDQLRNTGALKVEGDFDLKSKRKSPHFINIGQFNTGQTSYELAKAYAASIKERVGGEFELIYGIPEKGVGLAPTIATALWVEHRMDKGWFFTRKVEKTYGEATNLSVGEYAKANVVGRIPQEGQGILLIDDVFTTGDAKNKAINEMSKIVKNPKIVGLFITVDRQEVDVEGKNAIAEFTSKTGVPVYSAINALDVYRHLLGKEDQDQKELKRMAAYLRVYGTKEARETLSATGYEEPKRIINLERSVIPACDMTNIADFKNLVRQTAPLNEVGAYKIGFELGLRFGLGNVATAARELTDKPLIYDHQKGGTDIPDTQNNFARTLKATQMNAFITFAHAGPETLRAAIYRAFEQDVGVIAGGIMTHPGFLESEGGWIADNKIYEAYRIAARAGVREVVVPATKIEVIKKVKAVYEEEGVAPIFYATGFTTQGGDVKAVMEVLGNNWHLIAGRSIINAPNNEYAKAAIETAAPLFRR